MFDRHVKAQCEFGEAHSWREVTQKSDDGNFSVTFGLAGDRCDSSQGDVRTD